MFRVYLQRFELIMQQGLKTQPKFLLYSDRDEVSDQIGSEQIQMAQAQAFGSTPRDTRAVEIRTGFADIAGHFKQLVQLPQFGQSESKPATYFFQPR